MRAGRISRTAARTVVVVLFGLAVTAAGIVGVQASEAEEYVWDSVPAQTEGGAWGQIIESTTVTASEYVWD